MNESQNYSQTVRDVTTESVENELIAKNGRRAHLSSDHSKEGVRIALVIVTSNHHSCLAPGLTLVSEQLLLTKIPGYLFGDF